MKRILFFCVLLTGLKASANDTLTRAQVYDFNVGDTFDYLTYSFARDRPYGHGPTLDSTKTYSRYVINSLLYSSDSSLKYIQRINVFPNPNTFDTIVIKNKSGYEVLLDTLHCPSIITIDSTSQYQGRSLNSLDEFVCVPFGEKFEFASGLGVVLHYRWSGGCGPCGFGFDSTVLIYYVKGTEVWGTPYYDFAAVNNKISIFPTLNNGAFKVKTMDTNLLPINLMVYDITGKKAGQALLNNPNSDMSIETKSPGIYIWKALSGNQLIQTGKMVVY